VTLECLSLIAFGLANVILLYTDTRVCHDVHKNGTHAPVDCDPLVIVNQSVQYGVNALFLAISMIDGIFFDNLFELYAAMFQAVCILLYGIWKFIEMYTNGTLISVPLQFSRI